MLVAPAMKKKGNCIRLGTSCVLLCQEKGGWLILAVHSFLLPESLGSN